MIVRETSYDGGSRIAILSQVPTPREFAQIRRERLSVAVYMMPPGYTDLTFLEPVFDVIPQLIVQDYACRDARAVEEMINLRRLDLATSRLLYAVDLTRCESLTEVVAPWKKLESIADCVFLTSLTVEDVDPLGFAGVKSSLMGLSLLKSRRLLDIPSIPAANLTRLRVHGASALDLKPIQRFENLERLDIESIARIVGAAALAQLPSLKTLVLDNCPDIGGWENLNTLRVPNIRVSERNPFDAEFRAGVRMSGNWSFPSGVNRRHLGR